jgi:Putative beta-barrel porin-2, OmpL-like. bbp2
MSAFHKTYRQGWPFLASFFCLIAIPGYVLADDDKPGTDTAKSTPVKANSPEAALTERERWLLDQVIELRKRVADLESKGSNSGAAPSGQPTANQLEMNQPAVSAEVQPAGQPSGATSVALKPPVDSTSISTVGTGQETPPPATSGPDEPFSYADWTWLNGNPRTKDSPLQTKYFTGEFRSDMHYMLDFNHPQDDTIGGSTESFRSNEFQLEQLSVGGDLRVGNVRGRILTMYGLFSTTTPRNDPSTARGQWDLRDAYRYISEGWGGYHFNVSHGLNIDAGIFVSYIGLFSYYNFDNWSYQPSYVSSNTPWFFNGLRIQWFPTAKLKIEPWIINGWQSYARTNSKPGLGGQILWRPKPWLSMVSNNYGMGRDTLGQPTRTRFHTDNSVEVKYYDHPEKMLDKMAFSATGDLGCETGGGVSCFGNKTDPKQAFLGWMIYNRFWFNRDKYGITLGGGGMNNPGRYLTLLPPINGADAISGSPYFPGTPGSKFHAYDATATFDYMPVQYITFRSEMGYRHSDVPYWSGRGGITPPGGNNGAPGNYVCSGGANSGQTDLTLAEASCGGGPSSVWTPDLRKSQIVATIAILVKF